jgi:hypothetical protein
MRPKKNAVDYFPHDCTHGKTMQIISTKYGNNGRAFWWTLLETLGKTENHFIDYRDSIVCEYLASLSLLPVVSVTEILDTLSLLGAIDSELWQEHIIWSQNFVNRISDVYKKRHTPIPTKPVYLLKKIVSVTETGIPVTETGISGVDNPQSKVKYIKEEKDIVATEEKVATTPPEKVVKEKPQIAEINVELAKLLDSLITENFKRIGHKRKPITNSILMAWADDIRKLIDIDKQDEEEVRRVIEWCQQDSFWFKNILSGKKLRIQYEKLILEMKENKKSYKQKASNRSPLLL